MTQSLNHYEKILSRSHSNYLAQISIEMTEANNQINDVLSRLTALGTVRFDEFVEMRRRRRPAPPTLLTLTLLTSYKRCLSR